MVRVSIICALGRNRAIGRGQDLLWRISEDLKRFKRLTMGHPIIMGRKTYASIGRPLPGRTNIVITRNPDFRADGTVVVASVTAALEAARGVEPADGEIFVIGGGEIYAQLLPQTDRLYLTAVDDAPPDADTFFPEYGADFEAVREEPGEGSDPAYTYQVLRRRTPDRKRL